MVRLRFKKQLQRKAIRGSFYHSLAAQLYTQYALNETPWCSWYQCPTYTQTGIQLILNTSEFWYHLIFSVSYASYRVHSLFTHTHSLRELLISWRWELLAQELEEVEWQAGHGRDQKRLPGEHPRQDESLICKQISMIYKTGIQL